MVGVLVGLLFAVAGCAGVPPRVERPEPVEVTAAMACDVDALPFDKPSFAVLKAHHKALVKEVVWQREDKARVAAEYEAAITELERQFPFVTVVGLLILGGVLWVSVGLFGAGVPLLGPIIATQGSKVFLACALVALWVVIKPYWVGAALFIAALFAVFFLFKWLQTRGWFVTTVKAIEDGKANDPAFAYAIKKKVGESVSPATSKAIDTVRGDTQ